MKVLFLTTGTEVMASSRVRVYQYLPYLEKAGIHYLVIPTSSIPVRRTKFGILRSFERKFNSGIKYSKLILFSIICDVVFIQKVLPPIWLQNLIKLLNKNIVFDFDDALYASHQTSISTNLNIIRKRLINIIRISKYLVILKNEDIKKFTSQFNKNILTITGPMDCQRYFPRGKKKGKDIVIGWIGHPLNTPYLKPLFNVFRKISKKYPNVIIELIGTFNLVVEDVNIKFKKWSLDTEVRDLQNFDIGIMPLSDDEWSRGKGGYKLLQYMAVGIPCVASPIGINSQLIKEGINGYFANSDDQWYEKLEILIEDEKLRKLIGRNGRGIVEEQYSLKMSAPKLIKLIKKCRI